jgi:hypothetical protein
LIKMKASKQLHLKRPETVVFAEIQPCDTDPDIDPNSTTGKRYGKLKHVDIRIYPGMKTGTEIVDLTTIQSLIARLKWKGDWALFDRSTELARPVLVDE